MTLRAAAAAALAIAAIAADAGAQRFARRGTDTKDQQDAAEGEWAKAVDQACTARRYGLRLAASRKVAAGGDEAVPALRTWAKANGRNAIPAAVVNAIADADTSGDAVRALLEEWAATQEFYWRAQALRGLANRARPADRERFVAATQDPSFLFRLSGAMGLIALDREAHADRLHRMVHTDEDPRLRVKLAADLLAAGDTTGVPTLLGAVLENRTFLGDPWGDRVAGEAIEAMDAWLGTDTRIDLAKAEERRNALTRFVEGARAKGVDGLEAADFAPPAESPALVGGMEVRSCRYGDLFVGWDEKGRLFTGLEHHEGPDLGPHGWSDLRAFLAQERALATYGNVVCDFLRLRDDRAGLHIKCAPEALPGDLTAGVQRIASVLGETGSTELAEALLLRVRQFAETP